MLLLGRSLCPSPCRKNFNKKKILTDNHHKSFKTICRPVKNECFSLRVYKKYRFSIFKHSCHVFTALPITLKNISFNEKVSWFGNCVNFCKNPRYRRGSHLTQFPLTISFPLCFVFPITFHSILVQHIHFTSKIMYHFMRVNGLNVRELFSNFPFLSTCF